MPSKIFMGGMPELMENILNNVNDDEFHSIYSCALVSRHWCKMSIPILWQNPFTYNNNPLFISQYLLSLDENEKSGLKEYGINIKFQNTLFNYASFLRILNLINLESRIYQWINLKYFNWDKPCESLKCQIMNFLLKLFVENGAILHKLDLHFDDYKLQSEILHLFGRNERFVSQLQELSLAGISRLNIKSVTALSEILAKNTTKINVLYLENYSSGYEPRLLHAIVSIIKSQGQLREFSLIGEEYPTEFHGIISALESQKESLQEVTIMFCECNEEFKVLMNCKNLKILRIKYCNNVSILEPCLNTLEYNSSMTYASHIVHILEKSGTLLQRLKIESDGGKICGESLLLRTLKSFCPNITYLNISCIRFSTQFQDLICNLQKLQFLTLRYINDILAEELEEEEELKTRVMQFAKILPLTLQYLDLRYSSLSSYIDILLNNCCAPLKNLLINHIDNEKTIKALIKFCIRKRTLNYVGINIDTVNHIKKEVEVYVKLVPSRHITVSC
ncbi:hypothetical protein F8M41_004501 [Gigaspora margarita]|uniref:F-box domain-containing protein n=1 Tax=Gigaspora margarita TaxID=4874 RepID=A0A8H4AXQ0_GIGMA|nr:hypothetical protein F8M41_004501 [Gigaspora margarita]